MIRMRAHPHVLMVLWWTDHMQVAISSYVAVLSIPYLEKFTELYAYYARLTGRTHIWRCRV